MAFLRDFPTPQATQKASQARLAQWLRARRHPREDEKAGTIYHTLRQPQLQAPAAVVQAMSRLVLALVAQPETLHEHVRPYEEEFQRGN